MPTSATPQSFAAASRFAASSGYVRKGYASSSQVETTHDSASRHISNWSMTFGRNDEVEWMTTSAACSSTSLACEKIFTPQGASVAPTISPRSRPTFAGSVSMAPMISMACFSRISRATDAPIGPTPYWMARIFFFTSFSVFRLRRRTTRIFAAKETPTIIEFLRAFNEEPMRPVQAFVTEAGLLLARRLRRIMFPAALIKPEGGCHHAREKTYRF